MATGLQNKVLLRCCESNYLTRDERWYQVFLPSAPRPGSLNEASYILTKLTVQLRPVLGTAWNCVSFVSEVALTRNSFTFPTQPQGLSALSPISDTLFIH